MEEDLETRGQRNKKCQVTGCTEMGRVLATLGGDIEIAYCPKHRKKYGERILDALVNSIFNYQLTNFLSGCKKDIFMNDFLCENCSQKLKDYVIRKTLDLEKVVELGETNNSNAEDVDSIKLDCDDKTCIGSECF